MNKVEPIRLVVEDTNETFTLEFSRETVSWAESKGFDINALQSKPLTASYDLFFYAFRMHHKNVARDKTDAILNGLGGANGAPTAMWERLAELYAAPFDTLEDDSVKKIKVAVQM